MGNDGGDGEINIFWVRTPPQPRLWPPSMGALVASMGYVVVGLVLCFGNGVVPEISLSLQGQSLHCLLKTGRQLLRCGDFASSFSFLVTNISPIMPTSLLASLPWGP